MQKKLGFGMMRLPVADENDRSTVDVEHTQKMVDMFMQAGFNYFDTAHRYNDEMSEPTIRKTLTSRYNRSEYILTNKITLNYIKDESDCMPFFENQLKICGVDYFDNYLIHNLGAVAYEKAQNLKLFEFIQGLKEKGLVKKTGFSFHDNAEVLEKILTDHPEVDIVQLQINYLDWEDGGIQSRKCYEVAHAHGKDIKVMEPLKGGSLVHLPKEAIDIMNEDIPGASKAQWGIRFAASLEGVSTVLSGMSSIEQIEDNISYMKDFEPLSEKNIQTLSKVVEIVKSMAMIPCTGCRYCVTECPQNIAIPEYFALKNNHDSLENVGYFANQTNYYSNLTKTHGKAGDCVECGTCEENCPQHIKIRDMLKQVSAVFDAPTPSLFKK